MKIPKKIRITSKVSYLIVYVQSIDSEDGTKTYGYCDPNNKQIVLSLDQSETDMLKTLLHEIFHAMHFEWEFKVPHSAIHHLENSTFKMLKLNGWIKK